jgi:predicted PurR-regulated permease PerM
MSLIILGVFGGLIAFGFLGLFLGPVLLAVGFTLVQDWADNPAPAEPAGDRDPG